MKIIKIFALLVLTLVINISCDVKENVLTGVEGGLVEVQNPSLNYIVGNPGPYTASIRIYQGTVKTTKVTVKKTFHTVIAAPTQADPLATSAVQSNTVVIATINVDDLTKDGFKTVSFTFSDLIAGLKIGSANLSTSDGNFKIGDYWEFEFVSTTSIGTEVNQNKTTKVTVATRFAGKYKCVFAEYFRIGVLTYTTIDWPKETVIESVDAKTYRVLEYLGAEAFSGNTYYFQIDPATNKITYPAKTPSGDPQLGNAMPFINCVDNLADMAPVRCESSNYAILDNVGGKDQLYMSFGYYTPGSGPRVFYQIMEKIVE